MTFTPGAPFDPAALEAAVSDVDFTPRGVTVWLRGTVNTTEVPTVGADEIAAWLIDETSGQRFLLVADDDAGGAAIEAARTGAPGSTTLYGEATRADGDAPVRVHVQGSGDSE